MSLQALTGERFLATVTGGPEAAPAGSVLVAIVEADGDTVYGPSAAGVVEAAPGVYAATLTAPAVPGDYLVTWTAGADSTAEPLSVTAGQAGGTPATPVGAGPPQANASLVAVLSATGATGGREDWDEPAGLEPAGAGTVKWTGSGPVYYREQTDRSAGEAGVDVYTRRALYLTTGLARATGLDTDDVLVIVDPAGGQVRARATSVVLRELAGVPAELQTARVELQPT